MQNTNLAENTFTRLFKVISNKSSMEPSSIEEAKQQFIEYQQQGIILNDNFSDDKWVINNEYVHKGIYFNISKIEYKKNYEEFLGLKLYDFKNYLKTFIVFTIGEIESAGLWNIANSVKKMIKIPPDQLSYLPMNYIKVPYQISVFIESLPINDTRKDMLLNLLDMCVSIQKMDENSVQRTLADFMSYLRFDELLENFWQEELPSKDRMFFYPIFLWWKITGIIPTRPREFLLTPRDCIFIKERQPYITLRKTKLKGSSNGTDKVGYNIESDYVKINFPITQELYDIIDTYIKSTDCYQMNELNTLFIAEPHYEYFAKNKIKNSRFYTYVNLTCALRIFLYGIINQKYGYKIISTHQEDYVLDEKSIVQLHLGDTRHLAMINAILEGGSPETVMLLAGHSDIEISSHYYSNIATLIECQTYAQYKKQIGTNQEYLMGKNYYLPISNNNYVEIEDKAKCYSQKFVNGNIDDCVAASGPNGEIGYCPSCSFYRKKDSFYYIQDTNPYLSHIQNDTKLLYTALKNYRESKGYEEDVKEAVLKLQNSSYEYQRYFTDSLLSDNTKYRKGENEHGKATIN